MKKIDPMTLFQIVVIATILVVSFILFLMLRAVEIEALTLNNAK